MFISSSFSCPLLYDTFINQYLPDNISEYSSEDDKWFIDNIEIIENGNN